MSKFNFIYAEDLSHREKTVYIYLRDRADASGVCWPGIKTIAGELGLSPRTVQRACWQTPTGRLAPCGRQCHCAAWRPTV